MRTRSLGRSRNSSGGSRSSSNACVWLIGAAACAFAVFGARKLHNDAARGSREEPLQREWTPLQAAAVGSGAPVETRCRLPALVGLGVWGGDASCVAGGLVGVGQACAFEPADGVVCGAPRYAVRCGASGYLTRRPWCWAARDFDETDVLWGKHPAVEAEAGMKEWRARALKPEVTDGAWLDARCTNASGGDARRARGGGGAPSPLLVHFVSGGGDKFAFGTMLHVLAAFDAFGAARAFVHHAGDVASGRWWWAQLRAHPRVTLREIDEVESVFGHALTSHAHRADIIRLEVLLEFGGVYLDTDALALRGIGHLLGAPGPVAMAVERPAGLINAMIIAPERDAPFLARWYRLYRQGPGCWNCVSIVWPPRLAYTWPCDARVLPTRSLLVKGQYSPDGHERVFDRSDYDFGGMLAVHLFNNAGGARFKAVRPDDLLDNGPGGRLNNTYARMLRHAFGEQKLQDIARRFAGCAALADSRCGSQPPRIRR